MSTTQPATGAAVPATPQAGQIVRKEFGAEQLEVMAETAGSVLAAQARAMVEARFIVAMRRPRDWDDVRQKLLRACERPGFAGHATEKVWGAAWYRKPVGDGVEGFSIRFAEEALRAMGNVDIQTVTVYDDDRKRIVTVTVTDLESNVAFPTSLTIEKTIERKYLKKGEEAIRVRIGSENRPVYTLPATEDDVFTKQQNLTSKAMRNAVLRLLPGDIQAECRARILAIRSGDAAKDPDKVRREVSDGFSSLNVLPSGLKEYLGHDLATATPQELVELRELYKEIKAGTTTWHDALAQVLAERGEEPTAAAEDKKRGGLDGLTDKLKAESGTATTETKAKTCTHPSLTEKDFAALQPGEAATCKDCGELVEPPRRSREPGEDDGPSPAALPAEDPRAAVESVAAAANRAAPRQKKLSE